MSDFDDMFGQLDKQAPAALAAPTAAPAAPTPVANGMQSMFDALDKDPQIRATSNLAAAQSVDPDHAAKALQASRTTGIAQPAAEENLPAAQQAAQMQTNVATLSSSPALTSFVADNPLAARLAQDDFDKLSLVERLITAFKSGVGTAIATNALGREGNVKQVSGVLGFDTPETDTKIAGLQKDINAAPKLVGPLGAVQNFTGFLAGLVDNAVQGATAGVAGGAIVGGVGGAAAGGVGAVPGAIAGAGTGAVVGFNADMARVAAGNAYLKMGTIRGADGQQLSEGGKQFGAIFTGAATYALGAYGAAIESKVMGETAESLATAAIEKAVQTPTFASAVKQFAGSTAKGAAQGAGIMTAMEASGIIGEEIAKAASSGHFDTNPQEIVDRLTDAAINGAVLLGTMHGAMKGLSLYGDVRSAQRAESQTAMLKNIMDGSVDSKLRERDLQGFQTFMQSQTDGSPVENLYLPADKVRELYQSAKFDPATADRAADPLFPFVDDMPKQLEEAAASGGDVVIPTADFVTHLAGSPLAERLLPDLRVGADAMSVNEAKAYQAEYESRIKQAVDDAGKAPVEDGTQKISDEVHEQAAAAGYSDTVASKYAQIFAARYATRGERLGIDPYDLYKETAPDIQKGERAEPSSFRQDIPEGWGSVEPEPGAEDELGVGKSSRGSIRFGSGKPIIAIFENANVSTLMHEGGHAWLEELQADAARDDAPQQLKDDFSKVMEWFGKDAIGRNEHEKFARAAEAYLLEGKAPSAGLARAFSRFKQWLSRIYQSIVDLRTPINDDIRGVFDRLLATDAEIAEAKQESGLEPNFRTREDAGMTAAEWSAYTSAIDRANQQAESKLLDKMMEKVRRQRTKEYRDERAKAVEEATKEVDARPDVDALNMLRGTKAPGNLENIKLSAEDLTRVYGKDSLSDMPRGTTAKDGTHPDVVAEMLGFNSGDALVQALKGLEKQQREVQAEAGEKRGIRKFLIDQAADQKMEDRPDVLDDGSIRDEAQAAIHSEKRAELLAQEMRYLKRSAARALEERGAGRKKLAEAKTAEDWKAAEADLMAKIDKAKDQNKIDALKEKLAEVRSDMKAAAAEERITRAALREAVGISKPMLDAIRAQVDAILTNKTTGEIGRFGVYLRDERKAAREVQQAILKKDWNAAAAAKQKQLLSHVLYTRAREASAEVDRGQSTFKRIAGKASFKTIAQEYTDQMHDLLARFGFDSGRGEELQRGKTKSLEEFVNDKQQSGIDLSIDPALYAMQGKPLAALTLSEFRALHEAIDSMNTLGRGEKMITVDGVERELDEVKREIVKAIRALGEREKSDFYDPRDAGLRATAKEKLFGLFRGVDASLVKPEAMFDQIDKADPLGIMNQAIFRPLKEAQGREDRWQQSASADMRKAVEEAGKGWAKRLDDVVPDDPTLVNPETGRPMKLTRKRMISMALNWGNEGNRAKLADGYKWSPGAIKAFLDRNMTKADWDFTQKVWAMFDSHKQDLDDLQRRVTGTGLDMVQADAFDTPHGRYDGGYYPIVYDAGKSFAAETHAEKATDALFPNGYTRATTPKGSTISRVEGVKRPIQLSLDIAPWKIGQVLHDLAFRESIIDADRLLSSDSVKKAMDDVFGPEYRKLMRPWLKHIANSRNIDDAAIGWIDKAISTARTNTVIVGIGFRLSTVAKHTLSALSNSVSEVGPVNLLKATKDFYGPGMEAKWKFITDRSQDMGFRLNAYDKDVTSHYDALIKDSRYTAFQKAAQHYGHIAISYLDLGSAAPTWMAAYEKATSEGLSDKDASYVADKTVRNAHGAQGITDTAAIQRAKGAANLINMFYGFFNHIYNRQRVIAMDASSGVKNVKAGEYKAATKDFAHVLARSFWYVAVPALIEALIAKGGPSQSKDEGWGEFAGKAILGEIPAGIPIIRDIAKAAMEGRDYEGSPIVNAVNSVLRGGSDLYRHVADDQDFKPSAGKHIATAAGLVTGLPTAAPFTAGKFLWDVNNGDADPQSLKEWLNGLTTGKVDHE